MLSPPIRRNIKLAEAPSFGQTIFDYSPWCPGAIDYRRLAEGIFTDWSEIVRKKRKGSSAEPVVSKVAPVHEAEAPPAEEEAETATPGEAPERRRVEIEVTPGAGDTFGQSGRTGAAAPDDEVRSAAGTAAVPAANSTEPAAP